MKTPSFALLATVLSLSLFQGATRAQTPSAETTPLPAAEPSPTRAPSKLLYKPPSGAGNIPTRVSGGARGSSTDASLLALVPDHAALTTQAQPSLFWFQSKAAKAKIEMTLIEPKKAKPLLALTSEQANKAGIHRVKLANYKVELRSDVSYEWVVAIVPDAENRSKDVIAKGVIKRIKTPPELADKIEHAGDVDRAAIYAQAGIWYDALEAISNAIDASPDDASLRAQRASLLKQVGLPEAAATEKKPPAAKSH
ncbi:MAG: hypothetical protein QOD99_1674 [Chthoniobacter sp.]|nr:hypothetical protein [Chthoniobacter sp.]